MASVCISTARRRFTRVRLPDPHLTGRPRRFPICSLPGSLSPRSVGWFEDWSCNPSSEGLPPSSSQHDVDQLVTVDLRSTPSWRTFRNPHAMLGHTHTTMSHSAPNIFHYCTADAVSNRAIRQQYAALYRDVYAEEPWNEHRRCSLAGAPHGRFGKADTRSTCPHCGSQLELYWPDSHILFALDKALAHPNGSLHVAMDRSTLVGFALASAGTPESLEEDLGLHGAARSFRKAFRQHDPSYSVGYLHELAVRKDCRGRGIAKQLFVARLSTLAQAGKRHLLTQTLSFPPTDTYAWYTSKLGFIELARYGRSSRYSVLGAVVGTLCESLGMDR
jgi:ribosomal protein S18 acetylase RimI-like enzyme